MVFFLVAEVGFEPHDLRVMSPTSYQAALLRDIKFLPCGAGDRGRTGTILSYHGILSPGRLPIPPHRHFYLWERSSLGSHSLLYHSYMHLSTPFCKNNKKFFRALGNSFILRPLCAIFAEFCSQIAAFSPTATCRWQFLPQARRTKFSMRFLPQA